MAAPATILVVEDHHDQLTFMTHVLTRAGHRVVPGYGAEDAVRKTKTQQIDIVLTDLSMPKISGVTVIEAIKSDPDTKHIPVVVVTAHLWDDLGESARQAGADGYLCKPFTGKQLLEEVEKHLATRVF